jgi:hypothetical protein
VKKEARCWLARPGNASVRRSAKMLGGVKEFLAAVTRAVKVVV